MDLKLALEFLDRVLFEKENRNLSSIEITILSGAWEGKTYDEIANSSEYSYNYLMRDVGPKFWRLLSKVFNENVNKNNIRLVVEKLHHTFKLQSGTSPSLPTVGKKTNRSVKGVAFNQDWGNAPARLSQVDADREQLTALKQCITDRSCSLINLWGISGVGKTTLLRELAAQIQKQFDFVIWRSLIKAPTFADFVSQLPDFLTSTIDFNRDNLVYQLVAVMRSHSCLILLDGVEAILQLEQQAGNYKLGYEDYDEFFQLVGESHHKSCVITTSIESLGGIFQFTGENSLIRSLKISGLSNQAAKTFFTNQQLKEDASWQKLVEYYQGNPAMLSIATKIIRELFNEKISDFIEQKSSIFGEIDRLLGKSFSRLSALEKELLYWLASEEKPISFAEIQQRIPLSIYPVELLETIESLNQRCLIEKREIKGSYLFVLSPMIREFTINQFITQIGNDFSLHDRHKSLQRSVRGAIDLNIGSANKKTTHLSNWLQNCFELEWQPVDVLFTLSDRSPIRLRSTFHFRDRSTIKRFKEIKPDSDRFETVLLLIAISQETEAFKICVQAQPEINKVVLPKKLKLSLVDSEENVIVEAKSGERDNFIQLPYFHGRQGEKFKIRFDFKATTYEENFLI